MQATQVLRKPVTVQYREAFSKHYPNTKLEIVRDKSKNDSYFWVILDGDRGNFSLSIPDMVLAIQSFNRR